ncbi:hypothetical protein ABZ467_28850 [Streptomyces sp. NPDC005727]|uniref:hypothetical protein n=1 Tax=Streptomyces sp. NPDC005727 TaxID=3157053 RepID=UPI0033D5A510
MTCAVLFQGAVYDSRGRKSMIAAALGHLDAPPLSGPLPDYPALRGPLGIVPASYAALDARLARRALAAVLAGEHLPEAWMEEITAPGDGDEDEQRAYERPSATSTPARPASLSPACSSP